MTKPNDPLEFFIQNPHLEICTWTKVSAFEPEVNPSIIDEIHVVEFSAYEAEREKVRKLVDALGDSLSLMQVAEHAQDEEWYADEARLAKIYSKYKEIEET